MYPFAAAEMLDAWEAGRCASPHHRSLALLEHTSGLAGDALAALPVGHCDALLLGLREQLFGTRMECEIGCPVCSERLEFTLDTAAVRVAPGATEQTAHHVELDGVKATFHVPTMADFGACAELESSDRAAQALLARCIECVDPAGRRLNDALVEAIEERIAALDPQANAAMTLTCPQCAHVWIEPFDIGAFLSREIDAWAQQLLEEIHVLAASYGWSERDILALSPARRRYYVDRAAG